jgi:hypothetical protein
VQKQRPAWGGLAEQAFASAVFPRGGGSRKNVVYLFCYSIQTGKNLKKLYPFMQQYPADLLKPSILNLIIMKINYDF